MDNEIFRTRRAAWFGRKPVGVAAFREWMAQIEKRVERLEKAAGDGKLKIKVNNGNKLLSTRKT